MSDFSKFPSDPTIPIKPFTAKCSDDILVDLKKRVETSLPPRKTYENTTASKNLGVRHDWPVDAIDQWKTFDWYV